MVQCDECDTWYHYSCAGVNDSVANRPWKCSKCECNAAENECDGKSAKTETIIASVHSNASSEQRRLNLELERLEEEKNLEKKYLEKKFKILALSQKGCSENKSVTSGKSKMVQEWLCKVPKKEPMENKLTSGQLIARQAVSKELPVFNGKPEDWPLFYSSFIESTNMCGYTDSENLLRLQKCLKGKALDAVSCHLLLPKNVSEVIRTLKMIFGRPETILNTILDKIRAEPVLKPEKLESLVSYAIVVRNLCSTLEASGLETHLNNPLLLQEIVEKLPAQTKLNWAMYCRNQESNISTFSKWLFDLAEAVTQVTPSILFTKVNGNLHEHEVKKIPAFNNRCILCEKQHLINVCEKFSNMKLAERWDVVRKFKLCRICLKKHGNFRCTEEKCSVQGCEARHHKMLHKFIQNPIQVTTHSSFNGTKTYFKILPVTLHSKDRSIDTFAFLDDGSNVTLLEKGVALQLGLKGDVNNLCLKWTSDTSRIEKDSMKVSIQISACTTSARKYDLLNVYTVNKLSLPVQCVEPENLLSYEHFKNIPISTYSDAVPKILIGLNNGYVCNTLKVVEGKANEPYASKTRLGWVLHGGDDSNQGHTLSYHNIQYCDCEFEMEKLQKIVSEYLSLENVGRKTIVSPEIKHANFVMQSTTKRIGNRFETGLIWKNEDPEVPDSYPMAMRRLQCLEKKLNSDQVPIITRQIENLVEKGYARKLSTKEATQCNKITWYLPIFTVVNPNKPGKIRLVWDAAAKVRGVSLNSLLLKGPDLMTPLLSVLYGFRLRKIAICADIKEMFHQVKIREEDQNAQRFLWRNNETQRNPDVYVMQVMTFGAACSPSSAQYIKNKNALEYEKKFPRAAASIISHHYVDDLLDCTDTVSEATKLAKEVAFIHDKAGFFIRNWKSNSKIVMETLGELEEESHLSISSSMEMTTEKVLGMWWSTASDHFTFSLKLNRVNSDLLSGKKRPTKTDVLSTLMSIFDPLGFLSSFVVYLKILLQKVWRTTKDWKDEVNDEIFKDWLTWIKMLPEIEKVKIPRWYSIQPNASIQLHVFVDASELAYAAVAYFRIKFIDEIKCSLVGAKVKVAPKQPLSIPRMELMAAILGIRLASSICSMHDLNLESRCFWSDSNTVLAWLGADPRNYKQFVMFRIGEILDSSQISEWRYIPTKQNVADDATKWKSKFEFDMQSRWFVGPQFLSQPESYWPEKRITVQQPSEELRPHVSMIHSGELHNSKIIDFYRFSSWKRLLRTVGQLYKFIFKLKGKAMKKKNVNYLIPDESTLLGLSENLLYRQIQEEYFKDEIAILNKNEINGVPKSSNLFKCSPYLDNNKVLRMKGRIDLSTVSSENAKNPIILPRQHYCTSLLIRKYHEEFHHIYHELCLNELRQKYYIPRLRVEIKKVRKSCQLCKNMSSSPIVPEMAILPKARLSPFTRPFSYVGLDYFGPISVKVTRHNEKRWCALFTCLTIRAIHVEVVRDMTTDSCIMALQNFVARRGTPIAIYCDNGTNFRGASTELRNALNNIDFGALAVKFTSSSTTWNFNPPAAPHMGGSWERLVQSVKKILHQMFPAFSFRDDTLYNALLECEKVINSRPLTYVDLESTEDEALTPNHFLLGSSSGNKPIGVFSSEDCILRKNWRKVQYFADIFWKRWVNEYLPTLTKRTKWHTKCKPLEVGDVVIIVDPNLPRNSWPMGIVETVAKAKDGNVRSATVKTQHGILSRPVAKLAKLDVKSPSCSN